MPLPSYCVCSGPRPTGTSPSITASYLITGTPRTSPSNVLLRRSPPGSSRSRRRVGDRLEFAAGHNPAARSDRCRCRAAICRIGEEIHHARHFRRIDHRHAIHAVGFAVLHRLFGGAPVHHRREVAILLRRVGLERRRAPFRCCSRSRTPSRCSVLCRSIRDPSRRAASGSASRPIISPVCGSTLMPLTMPLNSVS